LITDDHVKIEAHKLILCSGSKMFEKFLVNNPHSHPMMFMKGIKEQELKPLLEYLYRGETKISNEIVFNFMKLAQDLEITGLHSENKSEDKVVDTEFQQNMNLIKELDVTVTKNKPSENDKDNNIESSNKLQQLEDEIAEVDLNEPNIRKHNDNRYERMLNENVSVQRIKLPKSVELLEKTPSMAIPDGDQSNGVIETPSHPNDYVDSSKGEKEGIVRDLEDHLSVTNSVIDNVKCEIDLSNTNIETSETQVDSSSEIILELDPSPPLRSRGVTKWTSPVWNWFILDPEDHTNAICQLTGCPNPFVSRGRVQKAGSRGLTTSLMRKHLFNHHGKRV